MSRDRIKFHFLDRTKSGCVLFEGNESARVLGSSKVNIGEKSTNADDVCFIEGLKHDILSVSQMVDGGKEVISIPRLHHLERRIWENYCQESQDTR